MADPVAMINRFEKAQKQMQDTLGEIRQLIEKQANEIALLREEVVALKSTKGKQSSKSQDE
uniref:Putative transposase n=1 Tax=Hot spring virus BHS1 TaxID=2024351 RepID=A0A2U7NST5_9VIRU|nr:putative transposase [Hot spring virus BHS1]